MQDMPACVCVTHLWPSAVVSVSQVRNKLKISLKLETLEETMKKRLLAIFLAVDLIILAFLAGFLIYCFRAQNFARFAEMNRANIESSYLSEEAIVVLTGDRNRIPKALTLLKSRPKDILIISGTPKGISLTDIVNQQYAAENVQQVWQKIVLESESNSTLENIKFLLPILSDKKVSNIILVTSDYHLYRAQIILKKLAPTLNVEYYAVSSDSGLSVYFNEFLKYLSYKFYFSWWI